MILFHVHIALFFLAILSLSQAAGLSKLSGAPPELISFWRLVFASLSMGLISRVRGDVTNFKDLRSPAGLYALLSGLFFWIHLWTFQFAAQNAPIANVMILFSINPMFTGIISVGFLKERFERRLIPAYLLSIFGIYILLKNNVQFDPQNTSGNLSALAAAFFFTMYILCGHQARKKLSNTTYTYFIYAVAGICFFFTTWGRNVSFTNYPSITWISIAGLVIFPTLLGHALFTYLLRYINVNWLSTGKLAEPIFASITAYLVFNEPWTYTTLLAFICTFISLVILIAPWKYWQKPRVVK